VGPAQDFDSDWEQAGIRSSNNYATTNGRLGFCLICNEGATGPEERSRETRATIVGANNISQNDARRAFNLAGPVKDS